VRDKELLSRLPVPENQALAGNHAILVNFATHRTGYVVITEQQMEPLLRIETVQPRKDLLMNVERRLADFRPDIVHIVNPAFLGLVGLRHARNLNVPVVASYHTDLPGYTHIYRLSWFRDSLWAYFRWLHNQADLNLAPSHFTRLELEAHGFEHVGVWSRGVDTRQFHPARRNAEWRVRLTGGHPDAPLLLYVGRLATEKRIEWLRPVLDALAHVMRDLGKVSVLAPDRNWSALPQPARQPRRPTSQGLLLDRW